MKIYTIGYEGRSFEEYLRLLERHGIEVVIDVRRNPVSRKYGFSKKRMEDLLSRAGIEYRHFPELGIETEQRRSLSQRADYERLFKWYSEVVLSEQIETLLALAKFITETRLVALTCFEADPEFCHRSIVSEKLMELLPSGTGTTHL